MEPVSGPTRRQVALGVATLAAGLAGCLGSLTDDGSHEHEHDDPPWEWGGSYELESGVYTYTYHEGPDPEMDLAFVPAEESDDHGLFHAGETATELFEADDADTVVSDGDAIRPSSETLYRIEFESAGETTIELRVGSDGSYSMFTAHVPDEFDAELRAPAGDEMAPEATELRSGHDHGNDDHDHENDSHDH
ncbi:hypothetical protein [Saliphagus sp. LR7]|uniref:hypothetical protein n=1 Tax=Saliphagus sp. LR7 TaxID=2282654 RepID=UPI000DF748F4|nr:hypothetical protein [Saliphagus sp. LR7]